MGIENFIRDALLLPTDVIAYHVSRELAELYVDKSILEGQTWYFDLDGFVRAEKCAVIEERFIFNHVRTEWEGRGKKQKQRLQNSWLNILWRGKLLEVLLLTWAVGYYRVRHHWIVADDRQLAEDFFDAVCEWSGEVRGEILVYQDGYFEKNKDLFDSIKSATFDNLVLEESLREEIRRDFSQFFASREVYERYQIPWKRGAVFIGPPGNGKTHTIKALINELGKPCIYVRSFKSDCGTDQESMAEVFKQARLSAPCVVVLEDLDAMINDENRAFFLNELDGFGSNAGVAVIATTNHPDKLDAAILDRPSRFDRKYHFQLPQNVERESYVVAWNKELQPEMKLSSSGVDHVVAATEGFSFAYLKELLLSATVHWMTQERKVSMDEVVRQQVELLRGQIKTTEEPKVTQRGRLKFFKRSA
ncbi:MAG TPA: AAA family ATPase [Pyrinomonadaceae bacterium]|nr:AAA family ATPase [Pyrinomonadaceae bacterium]